MCKNKSIKHYINNILMLKLLIFLQITCKRTGKVIFFAMNTHTAKKIKFLLCQSYIA